MQVIDTSAHLTHWPAHPLSKTAERAAKRTGKLAAWCSIQERLFIRLRPSHNFLFLNNQTCCLDTFVTKACFYRFFLHQTQSKRDGNVREKVWRTLFTLSPVLDLPVRPSSREVGSVGGLAASS